MKFKLIYALFFAGQLGFFVVIPIVGFSFLGYWLDKLLEIDSFFLFGGVFLGVAIAVHSVYKFLLPLLNRKKLK